MAFIPTSTALPSATFDAFFQGATVEEIKDYFSHPPVPWEPKDLMVSADMFRTLTQPN